MLRAILFDFNGVLLDDEHLHFELFKRVLGEEGLLLTEEVYYRDYVGFDDQAGFNHAFAAAGRELSAATNVDLCGRKAQAYLDEIAQGEVGFFPGAIELVRTASEAGLSLGVVSGALEQEIDLALERAGIQSLFRTVVAAEAVKESKPDPEGYLLGLDHLQSSLPGSDRLEASEVLAIEDTQAGLHAAKQAGLVAVAVEHTYDASHFAGADHITRAIGDLDLKTLEGLFMAEQPS